MHRNQSAGGFVLIRAGEQEKRAAEGGRIAAVPDLSKTFNKLTRAARQTPRRRC